MEGILSNKGGLLEAKNVFELNRKPLRIHEQKIKYFLGLSLPNFSIVLSLFEPINYENIRV